MWVPSAAAVVPLPHARDMSSLACAFTTSVSASFNFAVVTCRRAATDSSCALTPAMCRAASANVMFVPLTNVVIT